jgi:hypothetical protein
MKQIILPIGILMMIVGVLVNFGILVDTRDSIEIAMLPTEGLTSPHTLHKANNTRELLAHAHEYKPDVLLLNAFDYIENYETLFNYRAIATISDHYGLLQSSSTAYKTPKVAFSDKRIVEYYIESNKLWQTYNLIRVENLDQLSNLLEDSLVEYAIVRSMPGSKLETTTALYDQLVLLNMDSIDPTIIDENPNLPDYFFNSFDFGSPDEEALNEAVRWLYNKGLINTRYYYKDLVYSQDYWED